MNDKLDKLPKPLLSLPSAPEDYMVYVVGAGIALGALVLFLLFRMIWNVSRRTKVRTATADAENEKVSLRRKQPGGPVARFDDNFENFVTQTGLDLTPEHALAWVLFVACIVGAAFFLLSNDMWFGAAGLALGAIAVFAAFLVFRMNYQVRLQDQLPDGIALMARALRSGLSLEQAVTLVGQEGAEPLAAEFRKCDAEVKLGMSVHQALESMARQLQTVDMNALVTTIAVSEEAGGNLPLLLDRLAASARDRANFRAYFRAATALARVSVIPIALTVPILVICYFLWTPSFALAFMASPNAPLVIGAAVLVEIIGLYWIFWLLRFDY